MKQKIINNIKEAFILFNNRKIELPELTKSIEIQLDKYAQMKNNSNEK
jgi:hypothetical protein